METQKTNPTINSVPAPGQTKNRPVRRRRWNMTSENVRYFLPKSGSSLEKPDLGQEMPGEGEALVKAFRDGGVFYTVVAWNAVTEIDGNEPKIVKQAAKR